MRPEERPLKVEFKGHGGHGLSGAFHPVTGEPKSGTVISHCFTCSKDYKVIVWLAAELAKRGHPVLRFDFAGLGMSEGSFADTTLSTDIADLRAAIGWLEGEGFKVDTLIGHSLGGAASILTGAIVPSVRNVVVIGTSAEVGKVTRILKPEDWDTLSRDGVVSVRVGGVVRPIRREFIEDLKGHSLMETVANWNKSLLVIHGTADELVSSESQEALFAAARQPKAFFSLPGADHLFAADRGHARHIARVIEQWVELNGERE